MAIGATGLTGRLTRSITRALGVHSEYARLHQRFQETEIPPRQALYLSYDSNNVMSPLASMAVVRHEDGRYFFRHGMSSYVELLEDVPYVVRNDYGDPKFCNAALTLKVKGSEISFQDSTSAGVYYRKEFQPLDQGTLNYISQTHPPITKVDLATFSGRVPDIDTVNNYLMLQRGKFAPGLDRPVTYDTSAEALPGSLLEIDSSKVKVVLIPDLHAVLPHLELILSHYGEGLRKGEVKLVIKGDLIHPEIGDIADMSTSIIATDVLLNLIYRFPRSVVYEGGNHDHADNGIENIFGKHNSNGVYVPQGLYFRQELEKLRGREYVEKLQRFFDLCPLRVEIKGSNREVWAGHAGPINMRIVRRNIPSLPAQNLREVLINARYIDRIFDLMTPERYGRSLQFLLTSIRPGLPYGTVDRDKFWHELSQYGISGDAFLELEAALFENPQEKLLRVKPKNFELESILEAFLQQGKITADQKTVAKLFLLEPSFSDKDLEEWRKELNLPPDTLVTTGHTHSPTGDSAYLPVGITNLVTIMGARTGKLSVIEVEDGRATVVDLLGQSPINGMTWGN